MRSDASTQRGIICPEEDAMPQPDGHHARLVYSVIRGASPDAATPEHVRRSWKRCVDEYGLDPESKAQPVLVSHQELLVRKEQNLELVSLADADRKSTRLNSSHGYISYAVFCLKKKKHLFKMSITELVTPHALSD